MAKRERTGYGVFSDDTKRALATSYLVVRELGVERRAFLRGLDEHGFKVKKRTFDDWVRQLDVDGVIGTPAKTSGRPAALDDRQTRIFVGWVLDQNERNIEVHLENAVDFIRTEFGVSVAQQTVLNYLSSNGFASHIAQNRTKGYHESVDQLA